MPKGTKNKASKEESERGVGYLWGLAVVVFGVLAAWDGTKRLPLLYWPGVLITYFGFVQIVLGSIKGTRLKHWFRRLIFATFGLAGITMWTFSFVLAKVTLTADSVANLGNYPEGMLVGGMKWDNNREDLRINITNASSHDFEDVNFEIRTDMYIDGAFQIEPVCKDFDPFHGEHPAVVTLQDIATGETTVVQGNGTFSNKLRVTCSRIPHLSTVQLVIPLIPVPYGGAKGQLPLSLASPKRMPAFSVLEGDYWAVGKTRKFSFRFDYHR